MKNSKYGPKTKASKGEVRHQKLSVTVPHELYQAIVANRRDNETFSGVVQRLLKMAINHEQTIRVKSDNATLHYGNHKENE
jgi:hypothetical protein